ncbi:MAG: hypothetical protein WCO77_12595, partial [bacterium]
RRLLFPAVSPACRGERTCTKRDGLRPERPPGHYLDHHRIAGLRGKPARFVQGGCVPGERALGT